MSLSLQGIGVTRGIVIDQIHLVNQDGIEPTEQTLAAHEVQDEIGRYRQAVDAARASLMAIRQDDAPDDKEVTALIDAHLLMMDDHAFNQAVADRIATEHCNAEWALLSQRNQLVAVFDGMDDAYLRSKRDDVRHVANRILAVLQNRENSLLANRPDNIGILVADDIPPADFVSLYRQGLKGFITEFGGPLSHTAILARSLGIPGIVGLRNARQLLQDGETVIMDGLEGHILADPSADALSYYEGRQQEEHRYLRELSKLSAEAALTRDQTLVSLRANIELPQDLDAAQRVGSEGVGLYRTEFLYMSREDIPDEEEQFASYIHALDAMKGTPVTIRTLDIGADKQLAGYTSRNSPVANNPALGLRAIRLCLKDRDLFRPQLRALLRASAHGPLKIMIPMISNVQELKLTLNLIEATKRELADEGLPFNPNVPVGIMVEVPAVASMAEIFARHVDFFSIGTNDLIQYLLAIDRIDDEVNYLYEPLHPAVLRTLKTIIDAGKKANIPVSMCGEMAGDPLFTRLLLGLGLTEFSMHPASILECKHIIRSTDMRDLSQHIEHILRCEDSSATALAVEQLNSALHE